MSNWYLQPFLRQAQNVPYLIQIGVPPSEAEGVLAFLKSVPEDIKWMLAKIKSPENKGKTLDEYKAIYEQVKQRGTVATDLPTQKIQSLNIKNPSNKLFLHRYGKSLVNWGQDALNDRPITTEAELVKYIGTKLIPEISRRMSKDYPDNNYVKDVDAEKFFRYAMDEQFVQKAAQWREADPEKAKQIILDGINEIKATTFKKWHDFLTVGYTDPKGFDQIHRQFTHPEDSAFVFMMLEQLFDSSPETKYQVMNMFPVSVEGVYQIIQKTPEKQLPNFSLFPTYKKYFRENNCQGLEIIQEKGKETEFGWLHIPGNVTDAQNIQHNINRLSGFAVGNGWCFGTPSTAESYLKSQGQDFYLLLQGDTACVAMAYQPIQSKVTQIRGRGNSIPEQYCYQIRTLLTAKGLNAEGCGEWQQIKKLFKLEDELKDPEQLKAYIKSIETNFNNYLVLPAEFKTLPEAIEAATLGYCHMVRRLQGVQPENRPPAPPEIANDPRIIDAVKDYYFTWIATLDAGHRNPPKVEDLPAYVQTDPRLQQALTAPYINWIKRQPEAIFDCPDWIINLPEAKAAFDQGINTWRSKIFASPDVEALWERNEPEAIPQRVRLLPQIQSAYKAVLKRQQLSQGVLQPKDIKTVGDELSVRGEILRQIEMNPDYYKEKLTPAQQQNPQYRSVWVDAWARRLENVGPNSYGVVDQWGQPFEFPEIENLPRIQAAKVHGWAKLLTMLAKVPARQNMMLTRCPHAIVEKLKGMTENYPALKPLLEKK